MSSWSVLPTYLPAYQYALAREFVAVGAMIAFPALLTVNL